MNNYEINESTLAIIPVENNKSKIIEKNNELIINLAPMKIIDYSCKFFGSSYQGRFNGTKYLMGVTHKSPIIVEESRQIIFFPTSSPRLESCCWIALKDINKYVESGIDTIVYFSCGKHIKIEISYPIFDNQVLRASRLESILNKRLKKNA